MFTKIQEELKQAQLAKDEVKVATLRLLVSEIRNTQIAKGHDLADEEIIQVIQKEAKKRKESVESFRAAAREDLASREEAELKVLATYLPAEMSDVELTKLVEEAITELGATSMADMGKVMSAVIAKVGGRADGGRVSALVKKQLLPN